ncbi:MAG TPA: ABC transporter substrate-binding protein [Solirubrobacteraceae bacterium]|jgi:putative hydroxymethylpyrimidine transport system substrate-binding protein
MRRALALIATALLAAGCGAKSEPSGSAPGRQEPYTVVLDYFPNADHAALYAAQASGDYARAGLDVKLQAPPDPSAPLKLLQAGRADVAISYEPELMLARDRGATDLVSVGALVQVPLTSIIALPKGKVHGPRDLAGKRVGTAGIPYQSAYLQTILKHAGVNPKSVKETDVGFNLVPALLGGKVDAILGGFWNYEAVDLRRRGRKPTVLRMEKLGVPTYDELIFVVRKQTLDTAGASRLRRFLQATFAGARRLRASPAAGVDALLKASPGLDRGLQTAAVKATTPVFFPPKGKPFGWQDPAAWARYELWMRANGLLKRPPTSAPPLTNEFLPGAPLDSGP